MGAGLLCERSTKAHNGSKLGLLIHKPLLLNEDVNIDIDASVTCMTTIRLWQAGQVVTKISLVYTLGEAVQLEEFRC